MINLQSKTDCCGCNACCDACPTGALSCSRDSGGFLYPALDKSLCIKCGKCLAACPMLNARRIRESNPIKEPEVYAAIANDLSVRFDSTSGGLFSAFAEYAFSRNGFVGGAVWEDSYLVRQVVTDCPADLPRLRSSKYAQSNSVGFYKAVLGALETGRMVIVCGLP